MVIPALIAGGTALFGAIQSGREAKKQRKAAEAAQAQYLATEGGYSRRAGEYLEGIQDPDLMLTEQAKTRIRGVGREQIGREAGEVYKKMSSPMFARSAAGRAQLADVIGKTKATAAFQAGQTEMGVEESQMRRSQQMFQNKGTLAELRQRQGTLMQGLAGGGASIGMEGRRAANESSMNYMGLATSALGTLGGLLGGSSNASPRNPAYQDPRAIVPSTMPRFGTGTGSGTTVDTASMFKRYGNGGGTKAKAFIVGDDPTGQGRENQEMIVRDGEETHVIPMGSSRYAPVMMMNGDVNSPMVRGGNQRRMMEGMGNRWRPNRNDVTRKRQGDE